MTRARIFVAALALASIPVVALASAAPANAVRGVHARATIDRTTTATSITEAFFGDPVPVPFVIVSGTLRGCVPGTYVYAWIDLTQDGIEMSGTGALGEGEYICGTDGTVRVSSLRWDFTVPHAGRARAILHASGENGLSLKLVRWVTIPR